MPSQDQNKDSALAAVLILILAGLATGHRALLVGAVVVLVLAMTVPGAFRPLARVWFGFSHLLGEIVSRALLTLAFFCIVTPIAVCRRLTGKDSLRLIRQRRPASALTGRNHRFTASDLEKPF